MIFKIFNTKKNFNTKNSPALQGNIYTLLIPLGQLI